MSRLGCHPYALLPPDPLAVLAAWPRDRKVVMLHSGGAGGRARWSILAAPEKWLVLEEETANAMQILERELEQAPNAAAATTAPFAGGWIGMISYDFGCVIEPAARGAVRPRSERNWPLVALARCPAALVFDHVEKSWSGAGDYLSAAQFAERIASAGDLHCERWSAGELQSCMSPDDYLNAVSRAIEFIAAGDIFQANITQRFTATFHGSTRGFARQTLAASGAEYGAYLELPGGCAIVSLSPELFLRVEPQAAVTTRPIKGTRPIVCDPRELRDSIKDTAELNMIVDLMRNDLGRVCEFGSVRVTKPRFIETLPQAKVHHGVGEVTGTLREGTSIVDLLRATFPAGSITGAPKIRAMQVIDELEPVQRGPYCGAIGFISDCGRATFNVAIRTATIADGRLEYGAGGGIVADSDPAAEYRECIDKLAVLRAVLNQERTMFAEHAQ